MTTMTWDEVFDIVKLTDRLCGEFMNPTITIPAEEAMKFMIPSSTLISIPILNKNYIKRVYHNQDKKTGQWHTTVSWIDGSKTTVACQEGDVLDKEKGLAMCICKKVFGNKGNYYEIFKEFCKDD